MAFEIHKGTNISHWLSQSDRRGEERRQYFTRENVIELAALGMDHLRIPIDEEQMWSTSNKREAEAWDLLNLALDWCKEAGLRAIVDLHILRSHCFCDEQGANTLFSDPKEAEHLGDLWRDLSKEHSWRSTDDVAYELMNEAVAENNEDWNRVLLAPYKAIRERESHRVIAIGSNRWCQVQTFPDLRVPENDPNIILVVHFYFPMLITHYRAGWCVETRHYKGPVQYPGQPIPQNVFEKLDEKDQQSYGPINQPYNKDVMIEAFAPALAVAQKYNLPLWCNEFGVVNYTPDEVRIPWYRDFLETMKTCGIVWSNWDYRGQFGIYKGKEETIVAEALFPKAQRPSYMVT